MPDGAGSDELTRSSSHGLGYQEKGKYQKLPPALLGLTDPASVPRTAQTTRSAQYGNAQQSDSFASYTRYEIRSWSTGITSGSSKGGVAEVHSSFGGYSESGQFSYQHSGDQPVRGDFDVPSYSDFKSNYDKKKTGSVVSQSWSSPEDSGARADEQLSIDVHDRTYGASGAYRLTLLPNQPPSETASGNYQYDELRSTYESGSLSVSSSWTTACPGNEEYVSRTACPGNEEYVSRMWHYWQGDYVKAADPTSRGRSLPARCTG